MYDERKIAEMMVKVRDLSKEPFVLSVTEHFAGYFDELGITIEVKSDTSHFEIEQLKDRIASSLTTAPVPFKWLVMFKGCDSDGTLFPDGLWTGDS